MHDYWKSKPPPGVQVNHGHPLAHKLTHAYLFNEGSGRIHNAVDGKDPGTTYTGPPQWRPSSLGAALWFDGSDSIVRSSNGPNLANVPFSVAVWFAADAFSVGCPYGVGNVASANTLLYAPLISSATVLIFSTFANDLSITVPTMIAGRPYMFGATMDRGLVQRGYHEGRLMGSRTATSLFTGNRAESFGNSGASDAAYTGRIAVIYVWRDRVLTDADMRSLYGDRYGMLLSPVWRRAFVVSAVEIFGTLSSTLGSMALSATATVATTASLAATLGAATLSAVATVPITGTLNATLGTLTATATASNAVAGSASPTLGAATLSATGTVDVAGALSSALDALTASATATSTISGSVAATLAPVTTTAAGTVAVAGVSSVTLGALTLAASGTTVGAITGTLNVTLAALTVSATAWHAGRTFPRVVTTTGRGGGVRRWVK